jgi:hypothetical protein
MPIPCHWVGKVGLLLFMEANEVGATGVHVYVCILMVENSNGIRE